MNELLWSQGAHAPLLRVDAVEQVSQGREQVVSLGTAGAVGENAFPKRTTVVEGLKHRVAITGVAKL